MGKNTLVIGLMLNLLFGSFAHMGTAGEHDEQVLTLQQASELQEKAFHFTSTGADVKVSFKIPLFRSILDQLPQLELPACPWMFLLGSMPAAFNVFGKELLLSLLYPAHTFP